MARRMFSDKIVDTDAFLDMGQGSQLLYFHLAMRADDDGFVSNPKKVMRMIGSQEDDFKVLLVKRFIIVFESGVCVIKHWLIHNLIRSDRYTETQWVKEKGQLIIDPETRKYSLNKGDNNVIPNGNHLATQDRLGKDRLGKVTNTIGYNPLGAELLKLFEVVNPATKKMYGNTTQRKACDDLIETYSFEEVSKVIPLLEKTNKMAYFPSITTPSQLWSKYQQLKDKMMQKKSELSNKGRGLA